MSISATLLGGLRCNAALTPSVYYGKKVPLSINQHIRSLKSITSLQQDDRHVKDASNKRTTVDDDIQRAIASTRVSFKEDRKPWVGFNPFKEPVPSDWMSFLSQKIDWDTFIEDKLESRKFNQLRAMQEYSAERKSVLGGELAAARFVVAMNGTVKLKGDDHTYSRDPADIKTLPTEKTSGLFVEAVDLSNTQLIYEGVQNLFQMRTVLHLNLSSCPRLDEWSISRLAMMSSLVSLDLSHNSFITERCLIPLQHIPNLQRLNLRGIKYFTDVPLPQIFLEEHLPNCVITTDADDS